MFEIASEEAARLVTLTTDFLAYARPRPPKLALCDVLELLAETRAECLESADIAPGQLRLEPWPGPGAALVQADDEQLKTVFRELIANAVDAVAANRGTILLRCRPAVQDDTLEVLVEDRGYGMPPAVLQRAFDPFFSHRVAGRGRGLGLSRAFRILEAHAGRIWLESRPDEGTTAHVLLPRATPEHPAS